MMKSCELAPKDRHNQRRINAWAFAWIGSWLGLTLAIKKDALSSDLPVILLIVLTTALGLGMLFAYHRFLREADELRRKIELDALALSVGVTLVGGFAYFLIAQAGFFAEADVLNLIILLIATYVVGIAVGHRRYS